MAEAHTTAATRSYLVEALRSSRGREAAITAIAMVLALALLSTDWSGVPLVVACLVVGIPLGYRVIHAALHGDFGADLLGLIAMAASLALREWWVGAIIALMVATGEALEQAASARASAVLGALARRSPTLAHVRSSNGLADVPIADVPIGTGVLVLPHEICPLDGIVIEGHGAMDESYLTGEPYVVPKTPGSQVLSGAVNAADPLVIRSTTLSRDSRFSKIVGVLQRAEQQRPPIRRLADRLGFVYTLIALSLAVLGWVVSQDADRFLAVVAIATPCPLLIGVPVAVVGAISLAARSAIIIKDPSVLERLSTVHTMILDKTGTLTYGEPSVSAVLGSEGHDANRVLTLVASLEQYSRHPLATAVTRAVPQDRLLDVQEVAERPGSGLVGVVDGHRVVVTGRHAIHRDRPEIMGQLPAEAVGLECVVMIDDSYAATIQFRDEPRPGVAEFINHLPDRHGVIRTVLLSGDRESEVAYLAHRVGMTEALSSVSPEQKLDFVKQETKAGPTAFLGDGINDAPAMTAATVGIAFGRHNDVTSEAASAVVLDSSFDHVDELMHIGRRMRRIALQTAIGGIVLSSVGMVFALFGLLPPIAGAITQEIIDVLAIANATRVVWRRRSMSDFR